MQASESAVGSGTSGKGTGEYDRAFLEGIIDQYLAALVAHDPSYLPLAKTVKFAENDQVLELGDALWATVSGLGTYKLTFADTQAGQVGLLGTIRENGRPVILALRLKVEGRLITEVETLVARQGEGAVKLEALGQPDPTFYETLAPEERSPREVLIAAADLYFDGLEQGNGDIVPFADDCDRVENGTQTTRNPNMRTNPDVDWNPWEMGCREQFNTGIFNYIGSIRPRRTLIVDEERGLAFGFFMFNHPGTVKWVDVPGHGRWEMSPHALFPSSMDIAELFKVKNGKITKIEAVMTMQPYGTRNPFLEP
jgi:hypothetical protein